MTSLTAYTQPTSLVLRVHGLPAPQGSKRHVGHGVMVESSKKVKPWREAVKWVALEAKEPGVVTFPTGAVRTGITFWMPRPRSHYRTGTNAHLLRTGVPD